MALPAGSRRLFLAAAGAGIAGTGLAATMANAGAPGPVERLGQESWSDSERLRLYLKLRGDSSGETVGFLYHADLFALTENGLLPHIISNIGLSWVRFERVDEDRYVQHIEEASYYTDKDSGEIIETIDHPLIGLQPVKHARTSPRITITPDQVMFGGERRPDMEIELPVPAPFLMEPYIYVHEDAQAAFQTGSDGRIETQGSMQRRVAQLVTFVAPAANAFDERITSLPSLTNAILVTDSRPWVPTLAQPIPILWRFFGQKIASSDRLPEFLTRRLQRDHPEMLQFA